MVIALTHMRLPNGAHNQGGRPAACRCLPGSLVLLQAPSMMPAVCLSLSQEAASQEAASQEAAQCPPPPPPPP